MRILQDYPLKTALKKVVEQFQTMEQGAEKTQLAVDLFGRTGQELLPLLNQEVGSIDELFKSYEELGLIISDDVVSASEDLDDQLSLLKKSFKVAAVNIGTMFMPAISKVITGLLDLARGSAGAGETLKSGIIDAINAVIAYLPKIGEFAAMIIPLIVDTVVSTLPMLLDTAIEIVLSLANMLIEYLPELIPAAIGMILTLVQGLLNNLPLLIDTAIDLILAIVDGLINSLPIIIEMAPEIVEALINGIVYAIPQLLEAAVAIIIAFVSYLTDPNNLLTLARAGLQIMLALGNGMIDNIKNITNLIPSIFTSIKNAFANSGWIDIGKKFNRRNNTRYKKCYSRNA